MRYAILALATPLAVMAQPPRLSLPPDPAGHPALLAWEGRALRIAPLSHVSLEYGSDKLAFAPSDLDRMSSASPGKNVDYLSPLLRRSFDLEGKSPEEVSAELTRELGDRLRIWAGARSEWLEASWSNTSVTLGTALEEEVRLPGAPFRLLFSRDEGLQSGGTLDFSDFKQDFRFTSHVGVRRGFPIQLPALLARGGFFKETAWGAGLDYVMGHGILLVDMEDSRLALAEGGQSMSLDGKVRIRSAGLGLRGSFDGMTVRPLQQPVAGHGAGLQAGAVLSGEKDYLAARVRDAGFIVWPEARVATFRIRVDSISLYEIFRRVSQDPEADSSGMFDRDSVHSDGPWVTPLPARFDLDYVHAWDAPARLRGWSLDRLLTFASWHQALAPGPAVSFVPALDLLLILPWWHGKAPVQAGFSAGGVEGYGSMLGAGFALRRFSIQTALRNHGAVYFLPRRGLEFSLGMQTRFY